VHRAICGIVGRARFPFQYVSSTQQIAILIVLIIIAWIILVKIPSYFSAIATTAFVFVSFVYVLPIWLLGIIIVSTTTRRGA
jgi:hypothetical protein